MKMTKWMTSTGLVLGLLAGCSSEVVEEQVEPTVIEIPVEEPEQQEQEVPKPQERQILEMNTPILTTYAGEQDFELQITEVRFTNDRNEYYDGVPVENVVVIKVQGTNVGIEPHYLSDSKFNVYDAEGNLLDSYPTIDTQYSDIEEVNPGRKATIEIAYGIPTGTEFELEVVDQITGDIVGSLYFKGSEQTVKEKQQQEQENKQTQTQDFPYVLIQDDENAKVWRYSGSVKDFMKELQKEVELSEEQPELDMENFPLTTLLMVAAVASVTTTQECTLLTDNGEVIFTYVNGEPVAGAMVE